MPRKVFVPLFLWLLAFLPAQLSAVTYPAGPSASGVIDVTNLSASLTSSGFTNLDKTGATDNRVRLQALVDRFKQEDTDNPSLEHRILYFPDGTYRLSSGITGVTNTPGGGGILLQGQSRDGTILKLDDSASGFGSAGSPQQVISFFEGTWTNNAFYNGVEDLTIDVGTGNPGAVGLAFISNNTGYLRNIRIRTGGNGSATGHIGLLLNSDSGIGNPSGVGLIKGVEVLGFDYGIDAGDASQQGYALEAITLSGQSAAGIRVSEPPFWIRQLTSTNSVPAIVQTGAGSHVVVLDSTFNGGSTSSAAIERSGGHLFVRDITQSGYRAIIEDGLTDVTADLSDDEYLSTGSTVLKLWESTPSQTLDLPVVETPEVPWDANGGDWAYVDPTVQDDDTAAFQTALNSGASTICVLPDSNSTVKISSTLTIGPNVRRIVGQWNGIQPAGYLYHADPGEPIFKFASSNHPAVVIEKFRSDFLAGRQSYFIRHESASDLVLRDIFYVAGPLYRNEPGVDGRLFIEDVHCLPGGQAVDYENTPVGIRIERQTAYMRQVNPEQFSNGIINDGGTLWIFGFKVGEATGPVVRSINNATTEILGGVMNMTHDDGPSNPGETRILDIDRSNVSAVLLERFEGVGNTGGLSWGKNFYTAVETRGTETRTLENTTAAGVPRRPGQLGAMMALYVGYQFGATVGAEADAYSEGDGQVDAFVVSRGSSDTSSALTINYTVSGTAVAGSDYIGLPGSVTIPAGQSEAVIPVVLLDDADANLSRSLSVTLNAGVGYGIGQVFIQTIDIIDNDIVSAPGAQATLAADSTTSTTVTLRNPTGSPQTVSVIMPSSNNYEYRTSNQSGGPVFDWTDISGLGSKVLDNADDAFASNINIGFPFPYYGDDYSTLAINSNGFISFATSLTGQGFDWKNLDLRGTGGWPAMIAPFWEDLNPASAGSDAIYYLQADADTFIVQWNNLRPFGDNQDINKVTFQLILKRSGAIYFQYLQINSEADIYSYTTGLKNLDETKSLLISLRGDGFFNEDFVHALMAIRINPLASWISANTISVVVPAGGSATVDLSYDSTGLDGQQVATEILFDYPDPAIGTITLPTFMIVTGAQPPLASSVAILGTPEIGQTLTASYSYSDPESDTEGATRVEWLLGTSASGPFGVAATGGSFLVPASTQTQYIKLRITPVSVNQPTHGTAVESSVVTVPGSGGGPVGQAPTASAVTVVGSAEVGQTLTASYTYSDPESDPEGSSQIEWLRASSENGTYSVVATTASYPLHLADLDFWFKVRVTPVSTQTPTTGNPATSVAIGPVTSGAPGDLPDDLAGYWHFDDGQDPATDASGFERHAALQTGSTLVPMGRYGDALEVTAAGGAQAGNTHFMTGDFTIAAWVRHDGAYTTSTNEIILSKGWDFYLAIDTSAADGKLRVQFKHSGGTVSNAHLNNAKTLIPPDTWTHVAAVRSGATFTFYINGTSYVPNFVTAATTAAPDSNTVALAVGANPLSTTAWWRGSLDEVQLYTRALGSGEISTVAGFVPDVFASWKSGVFASLPLGANDPDAADLANPDGDLYVNFFEFAFRLDPLVSSTMDSLPFLETVTDGVDDYLALSYVRRRGTGTGTTESGYSIDGITYTVLHSETLLPGSWQTGPVILEEVSVDDNFNGTETVTVRSQTTLEETDRQFFRLKLE